NSGTVGTSVIITGTGFNAAAGQNVVFFGATQAAVTAASPTSLTVTVPLGTTYQYPTVTNLATGLTAFAPQLFTVTLSGAVNFAPNVDLVTGDYPTSVSLGDVDGDGKPDLVVGNQGENTVSVLRNTGTVGTASFAAKVDFATTSPSTSVTIGDVDGDGKPDLVVTNATANTVSVLRNTGTAGTLGFAAKVDFATGNYPRSVSIGDVDGDGKPDLAVANANTNQVSVLRNTGTVGTVGFAASVEFTTDFGPSSVTIGDVDGDGKPDLATANANSSTISVLRNTSTAGTLGFAANVTFAVGFRPYSLSIGDVDGDGKPDLAVANYNSSKISVLRNTSTAGTLGFAANVDFATGFSPSSLSIGDVDGDGKPDLATANFDDNTVSVLRNTSTAGTLGFAARVDLPAGGGPSSVIIGDVDGDGKPDLATANANDNRVAVLLMTVPVALTNVSPAAELPGQVVTLTGTGFTAGSTVSFGG
ncbi:FG-GAP-like repeat-containing protein, partial [Hymenobacter agri]